MGCITRKTQCRRTVEGVEGLTEPADIGVNIFEFESAIISKVECKYLYGENRCRAAGNITQDNDPRRYCPYVSYTFNDD